MTLTWKPPEHAEITDAITRHPVASHRCAALARVVHRVALPHDDTARGIQVRPRAARWIQPKPPAPRVWASHTLVETREHRVDALTGPDGCDAEAYLREHFRFPEALEVHEVDVQLVDPGIENEGLE